MPGLRRLLPLHRRLALHLRHCAALGPRGAAKYLLRRTNKRLVEPLRAPDTDAMEPGAPSPAMVAARRRAFQNYRPQAYHGVVTLLRAAVESAWDRFRVPEPLNGWDGVCDRVDLHTIPGDHMSIIHEPSLSALGRAMHECLERVAKKG